MKFRLGFVSNSSSASFILKKKYLTPEQIQSILVLRDDNAPEWKGQAQFSDWKFEETNKILSGCCFMDNFGMKEYIFSLGINTKAIVEMEEGY
jgi:hypothetical protein